MDNGAHAARFGSPADRRRAAGSFVPCVGGQLQLSPFYAKQTLTSEIKALRVSSAPSPFAATNAAEPPTCQASALRAQVTSTASTNGGAVVEVRLGNTGRTCVLPESWPTVKVHSVGDSPRVAKIFTDSSALQAERSLLTTYDHGAAQNTALTLRRGDSVLVALLAPSTGTQACQRLTSVTIYPSSLARGAGPTAVVTAPVSICGPPRILSFLPDRSTSADMTIARAALVAVRAGTAESGGDSTGFYYGTDSSAPAACGKGPYTEPVGSCSQGTAGPYGEYIGEVGSFLNWKGCTTAGLNWVQSNYNMANDNILDYGLGLGAAGYWFAAGPGRDPHYNGTAAEATTWGEEQAQQVIASLGGFFFNFRYIFLDIENNGTPPDENGWNTVWNGACGSTVEKGYIAPDVDYATYQGFVSYINQYTPYSAAVYSAGGNTYGSWSGIFGGQKLQSADEWTFTDEQTNLDRPAGFANSGSNARWFGGEPAVCHLLWQYSGGNGDLNGYGDFDQARSGQQRQPRVLVPGVRGAGGFRLAHSCDGGEEQVEKLGEADVGVAEDDLARLHGKRRGLRADQLGAAVQGVPFVAGGDRLDDCLFLHAEADGEIVQQHQGQRRVPEGEPLPGEALEGHLLPPDHVGVGQRRPAEGLGPVSVAEQALADGGRVGRHQLAPGQVAGKRRHRVTDLPPYQGGHLV